MRAMFASGNGIVPVRKGVKQRLLPRRSRSRQMVKFQKIKRIMGSIRKGIQGGFSGKVGNVVGAHWRGIDYMRSLPRVNKGRPVSDEQLEHRLRFAASVAFAKPISYVFNIGYGRLAKQRATGYNLAVAQIYRDALVGEYPDISVDPAL